MKRITKNCSSLRQAEHFQFRLYGKYNSVRLVQFPRFSGAGTYVWVVSVNTLSDQP